VLVAFALDPAVVVGERPTDRSASFVGGCLNAVPVLGVRDVRERTWIVEPAEELTELESEHEAFVWEQPI